MLLERSAYIRFLDQHSAFEELATDFLYRPTDDTATLRGRSLGGSYTVTDKAPPALQSDKLAFYGEAIDVDESHEADAARGLMDIDKWLDKMLRKTVRDWAKKYENAIFNGAGTGTPLPMKGLSVLIDGTTDIPGFTGYKAIANAADADPDSGKSFDLSKAANEDAFIEALTLWLTQVDNPQGIVMNKEMFARMTTIARRKHMLGESRDLFGVPVPTFNNVPMIQALDGSITNTEDDDTAEPLEVTTSIYIQSPGEMKYSIATNSGLHFHDVGELEGKESQRMRWEIRSENKIEEKDVILRVRNIKL